MLLLGIAVSTLATTGETEDFTMWSCGYTHFSTLDRFFALGFVVFSLYATAALIERGLALGKALRVSKNFEPKVILALRARQWDAALETCRNRSSSLLARVAEPAILEMELAGRVTPLSAEHVRLAIERAVLTVRPGLKKEIRSLLSISILAPMIGLLITLVDCSSAFTDLKFAEARSVGAFCGYLGPTLTPFLCGIILGANAYLGYLLACTLSSKLESRIGTFEADLLLAYVAGRRSLRGSASNGYHSRISFLSQSKRSAHRY